MVLTEVMYSAVANKCPRCHKGRVFESNNAYNFKNGLKMNTSCSVCNLKYEREPGFFYGAMYVSYGLMVGLFIVWFVLDLLWLHLDPIYLALFVTATILVSFPLAFRMARIIWLNFFVRYDKSYANEKENKNDAESEKHDHHHEEMNV